MKKSFLLDLKGSLEFVRLIDGGCRQSLFLN